MGFREYLNESKKLTKKKQNDMNRHFFQELMDAMGNEIKLTRNVDRNTPSGFDLAMIAEYRALGTVGNYGISGSNLVDNSGKPVLNGALAGKYTISDLVKAIEKDS